MYSSFVDTWTDWLRALMKRLDVNNKGLAALLSVSPTTVANWLAGGPPEADSILSLAKLSKDKPTEIFAIAYGLVDSEPDAATAGLSPREQRARVLTGKILRLADYDQDELDAIVEVKLARHGKG